MFAVGDDNALWQKWQVAPSNGWSGWKTLGKPFVEGGSGLSGQFTVGSNQDGRQEVFAVENEFSEVYHNWQTAPNGGWSGWEMLHKIFPGGGGSSIGVRGSDRITVGRNEDGRQELFVIAEDDALWHIWQVFPNAGGARVAGGGDAGSEWSNWESLGKPRGPFPEPKDRDLSQPLVKKNADGHLEVFAPGNGAFCNRWQEAPNSNVWRHEGWNAKPKPQPAVGLTWLEAARNVGGPRADRLEVFALGDDGALWHAWQIDKEPFWSPWDSLGSPAAKIREAEHLTIGTNQDGRLEVFVVGQDGAVWHIGQTR
jgi:hypothetical protein